MKSCLNSHARIDAAFFSIGLHSEYRLRGDSSYRITATRGERNMEEKLANYLKKKIVEDERRK